jgi:hypothetical protein
MNHPFRLYGDTRGRISKKNFMPHPFAFSWRKDGRASTSSGPVYREQVIPQAPGSGITGMPFTKYWVLDTITRSPAFNPDVTE